MTWAADAERVENQEDTRPGRSIKASVDVHVYLRYSQMCLLKVTMDGHVDYFLFLISMLFCSLLNLGV